MPSRDAVSRSTFTRSWSPLVCWSVATSFSSGSLRSRSSTRGAHCPSSSRLGDWMVYWYCVPRAAPAHPHVLHRLEEELDAAHPGGGAARIRANHLVGAHLPRPQVP